jgi:hypothetical protein
VLRCPVPSTDPPHAPDCSVPATHRRCRLSVHIAHRCADAVSTGTDGAARDESAAQALDGSSDDAADALARASEELSKA